MINSNKTYKSFIKTEASKLRASEIINKDTSKYFPDIGSIPLEDIPYSNQIEIKEKALKNIYPSFKNIEVAASDQTYNYRFKMDYVCSYNPFHEPNNRLGQRKAGKFNWVIDMTEAVLFSCEWFNKARKLFELALEQGIELYDLVKH